MDKKMQEFFQTIKKLNYPYVPELQQIWNKIYNDKCLKKTFKKDFITYLSTDRNDNMKNVAKDLIPSDEDIKNVVEDIFHSMCEDLVQFQHSYSNDDFEKLLNVYAPDFVECYPI